MDSFGDLFGGLGELFGGDAGAEGIMGVAEFFSPDDRQQRGEMQPIVYERFLCGAPRTLDVNDR